MMDTYKSIISTANNELKRTCYIIYIPLQLFRWLSS